MLITILLSFAMMAGLFLVLWAEVGFIQDKRFASSCPKEELEVMPDRKPERFRGQYAVGWCIAALGVALLLGAVVLGAWNGIKQGFTFLQFFARFAGMLLLLKAFDIGFFDWFLLCNKGFGFFVHYYPEVDAVLGRHLFGYNKKSHMIQILLMIAGSLALAGICILF